MSKCVKCGNEILTGDIHWEMGLCNNCYNELYKDHKTHISLDKMWLKLAQDFRDENEKLQDKISDLEAKLAESEKERHEEWKTGKEWKWEWQKVNQKLEKADQDKISFAVEQLEKVKAELVKLEQDYSLSWCGIKIYNFIDDQIKELKGEK